MELKDVIILCQKKKEKGEKALFQMFAARVFTICRRYSHCEADAKDYLQECFIQIYEKINHYEFEKGAFESWLYRVSINKILKLKRDNKRKPRIVYLDEMPDRKEEIPEEIDAIPHEIILKAIQQLPDGYRDVFNLFVIEKWTHKAIALALDITESSSRSQLTRAKRALAKKIKSLNTTNYGQKWA